MRRFDARRYKHWAGVCGAAIATLASMRPLLSDREQMMSVLIAALGGRPCAPRRAPRGTEDH